MATVPPPAPRRVGDPHVPILTRDTVDAGVSEGGSGGEIAADADEIGFISSASLSATNVEEALDELDAEKADLSHSHSAGELTGISEIIDDRVNALVTPGAALTKTYNDGSDTYTLDVAVDDTTIEVSSDALRVKTGGVTAAHLSFDPATQAELDAINSNLDSRLDTIEGDFTTSGELSTAVSSHASTTTSVHGVRDLLDLAHMQRMSRVRSAQAGWLRALTNTASAPAKILFLSDSWDDDLFQCFARFEESITARINGIASSNGGWNPIRSQTTTWTFSGTAGSSSTAGPAAYAENMPVGRVATSPLQNCDRISFHGAGTFDILVKDGTGATVQTANGQVVTASTPFVSNDLSSGTHQLQVTSQHASSVGHGCYYYLRNYASGVQLWRLGHSGHEVEDYTGETHWVDLMNYVDPHAIVIEVGLNNRGGSSSDYRTALNSLYTILSSNQSTSSYYIWFGPEPTGTTAGVWNAMYAEAIDFADDNNIVMVDGYRVIPSLTVTYSGDGVHPNATLRGILSDMFFQTMMGTWAPATALVDATGSRAAANIRLGVQESTDLLLGLSSGVVNFVRADLGALLPVGVGDASGATHAINRQTGDARYSQLSIYDGKGEIIAGTDADAADNLAAGANGSILTATSSETTGLSWALPAQRAVMPTGAIVETVPRLSGAFASRAILTSGQLYCCGVWLAAGVTVTSITWLSSSTALSGGTNQWAALLDQNRVYLRLSPDDTTNAWAGSVIKTFTLTSPYITTYAGLHYLCLMVAAGTVPTLVAVANTVATHMALPPILVGQSTSGMTTPPSEGGTAGALTVFGNTAYGYAS